MRGVPFHVKLILIPVVIGLFGGHAFSKGKYDVSPEERKTYIQNALLAVSSSSEKILESIKQEIKSIRSSCQSQIPSIEMECILGSQKTYCRQYKGESDFKLCLYRVDIVMNNKLSESFFLTNHERYKILKNGDQGGKEDKENRDSISKKESYDQVLMNRYAHLLTKMILWDEIKCQHPGDAEMDVGCWSEKISQFCQKKRIDLRQSWQACTGAMIWFVGSHNALDQKKS